MKVSYNWLKQYTDFGWTPAELGDRLTMAGMEVERLERVGAAFEGIVVAEIASSEKHPNADKLSVCRVRDGSGERQIVCGARNYKPGDKVPLALPGAKLPDVPGAPGLTIKTARMRGVESQGMLCSGKELGLADDAEGLLILSSEARPGQPFAEYLGASAPDTVYDLEITPNRPDLNSVIGVAREISALTGRPLRLPAIHGPALGPGPACQDRVRIDVRAPDLCPRYVARMVCGITIGPSPAWLREAVEKSGLRSINNVVDVTNFVMLETGQPLHAFDYALLQSGPAPEQAQPIPTIIVRRAAPGETFVTLDGQKRVLTADMLVIADPLRPIALAGVMGGENSEIQATTRDVLLESACFQPENIRSTSKVLALRTDAAYRFERGTDIEMSEWASRRAAELIVQVAGGAEAAGSVDVYPRRRAPVQISFRPAKVSQLLGLEIPAAEQIVYLRRLGLEVHAAPESEPAPPPRTPSLDSVTVEIPSFRLDLKDEIDLVEEVTRLYGVDKIPSSEPAGGVGGHPFESVYDEMMALRRILSGFGFTEVQSQTLLSAGAITSDGSTPARAVELANPLSEDMDVLRPSLLPGLISILQHNAHHRLHDLGIFELGRIFNASDTGLHESWSLALALTGQRQPAFWSQGGKGVDSDIYDLKGALEDLSRQFGLPGISYGQRRENAFFAESAPLYAGKDEAGEIGQLLPSVARGHDLRKPVFLAELNLSLLLSRRKKDKVFKALPMFPSIRRDIAMIVPEATTHQAILAGVKAAKAPHLVEVELFDIFRGQNVPDGQKSVAYAFTYRSPDRTLTDAEVNQAHEKLSAHLKQTLPATIREG